MFKNAIKKMNEKQREFGPTKKMKNTYVVDMDVMADWSMFQMCDTTPLAVVELNGVPQQDDNGWMKTTAFPNPAAFVMTTHYRGLAAVMGKKMAGTIVEYLDRETGEPVAMLFPTNQVLVRNHHDVIQTRLNHATRRDFYRQYQMREKFIAEYLAQKQK
ncbi:MAG: hypothetical protein K2L95_04285 [Alphaproteobacteria bacterium]|nr:hypothetical protein [Alphaproteobacteria bacterium]